MAVFDIGLLSHFSIIFPFMLVFAGMFAILSMVPTLGDNRNLKGVIAAMLAFIFVLSEDAVAVLNFASPWFVIFFFFIIFVIIAFKIFGIKDEKIANVFFTKDGKQIIPWLIIVSVLIMILGLSDVFGQRLLNEQFEGGEVVEGGIVGGDVGSSNHEGAVTTTIFHPKVISLVVLLGIAALAIKQISIIPE